MSGRTPRALQTIDDNLRIPSMPIHNHWGLSMLWMSRVCSALVEVTQVEAIIFCLGSVTEVTFWAVGVGKRQG